MSRFRAHFFVCINRRPDGHPKGCCATKGGEDIAKAIKIGAYEAGLKGVVRVNKAGCLDACETGVSAVLYPQGVWYQGITMDDVDEIVQRTLIDGEIIDRLVLPAAPAPQGDGS
jgi:(2Fe-2S) ferredoxin